MIFNSIEFLYFFIVTTTLFFVLPHKIRWFVLLVASCVFYMFFKPVYILIMAGTIIVDYYAGILIDGTDDQKRKRNFLIMSLVANIGVLAVFKYYNFINTNITGLVNLFGYNNNIPYLKMILPIGLSFHTFQAMSYTIEVYRGKYKAEKHFGIYALYVMFYPQLVAGPIERPQNILYQFRIKQYFNYDNAVNGLNLILFGLFKKMVIADRLSIFVNQVYSDLNHSNSTSVLIAVIFFSVQIYCDFSGYSDIARGTAKLMGFELLINFNRPYASKSVGEFWRRWHISLSTWFRDYLYISLGGNRVSVPRWYINLFIVFLVSGIWHGANWTFVIWGALHGLALIFELMTSKARQNIMMRMPTSLYKYVSVALTFTYITITWIVFRAENINQAFKVINRLFSFDYSFRLSQISGNSGSLNLLVSFFLIGVFILSDKLPVEVKFKKHRYLLIYFIAIVFLTLIFGVNGTGQFIYFQF